jgi:hypothetical protein
MKQQSKASRHIDQHRLNAAIGGDIQHWRCCPIDDIVMLLMEDVVMVMAYFGGMVIGGLVDTRGVILVHAGIQRGHGAVKASIGCSDVRKTDRWCHLERQLRDVDGLVELLRCDSRDRRIGDGLDGYARKTH